MAVDAISAARRTASRSFIPAMAALTILLPNPVSPQEPVSIVDVRIVMDEADAVLAILTRLEAGQEIREEDWTRLFSSEGFLRWAKRERSLDRPADEESFRSFVLSDSLRSRAADLKAAIDRWKGFNPLVLGQRALLYLPEGAKIRAKLYPVIKPTTNSFVFEVETDPAIFISVDPDERSSETENTLVHELHHIGTRGLPDCEPAGADTLSPSARTALDYTGGFLEGIAVLAAAGSPEVHPHAGRDPEEYVVWERDVARLEEDFAAIEAFLLALLRGEISEEEAGQRALEFISTPDVPQGPYYTLGWKMAAVVMRAEGRERVIEAVCDMRVLLTAWNRVAAKYQREDGELPRWSEDLLDGIGAASTWAPTGLTIAAGGLQALKLSWIDNATNEEGYRIERRDGQQDRWAEIGSVGTNVTTYVDDDPPLPHDTKYCYRVIAINADGVLDEDFEGRGPILAE